MLKVRLLTAALILVPLLSMVYLDYTATDWAPGLILVPLALIVAAMAAGELHSLMHHQLGNRPAWPVISGALGIMLATALPLAWDVVGQTYPADCPVGPAGWPTLGLTIAVVVLFILEMRRFDEGGRGEHLAALSGQIAVVVYAGVLPAYLILLRRFDGNRWGMLALVSMLVISKMGDTTAYFSGKLWGKRKLSPKLSPGKTVAGGLGSMIGAILSALACGIWLQPALTNSTAAGIDYAWWAGLGAAVGAMGMVGDLAESLLKRDAGTKDSSSWMPGLGGILDVIDSVLFAAPVAYLFWLVRP